MRMHIGEDQNKVTNIVRAQTQEFRSLYTPVLKELEEYVVLDQFKGLGEQDTSPPARLYHLSMLPKRLQVRKAPMLMYQCFEKCSIFLQLKIMHEKAFCKNSK